MGTARLLIPLDPFGGLTAGVYDASPFGVVGIDENDLQALRVCTGIGATRSDVTPDLRGLRSDEDQRLVVFEVVFALAAEIRDAEKRDAKRPTPSAPPEPGVATEEP